MHEFRTVLMAGVVAAFVLACGDSAMEGLGQMLIDAGQGLANSGGQAAAQAGSCTRWEVMVYEPDAETEQCETGPCTLPGGWEPFANHQNWSSRLWARRCAR